MTFDHEEAVAVDTIFRASGGFATGNVDGAHLLAEAVVCALAAKGLLRDPPSQ